MVTSACYTLANINDLNTAARQDDPYYDALIDNEEYLVEAVTGEMKWSSGLNVYATTHTKKEKFPGKNLMGKVHMKVRQQL